MGVVSCFEIMDRRRGGVDANRHRTYERVFRVEFDSAISSGTLACQQAVYDTYGIFRFAVYIEPNGRYDRAALAESIESTPEDAENCFSWITVVKYSSQIWDDYLKALQSGGTGRSGSPPTSPHNQNSDSSSPENPLNRPANLRFSTGHGEKMALEQDYSGILDPATFRPTGIAVANSAGDRFDPPVEIELPSFVITVSRNEANLLIPFPIDATSGNVLNYTETMNSDVFRIGSFTFLPGQAHIADIQAESVFEDPWSYFKVTYEIQIRYPTRNGNLAGNAAKPIRGWDIDKLDQGRRELVAAGSWMQQNYDKYGTPSASDIPLDGAGRALTVANIQARNFQYRAFRRFIEASYTVLQMPHI